VVRSDGGIGGFAGGPNKKKTMLIKEGVAVKAGRVDLSKYLYDFSPKR
jgi:alkylated DNA nucleotide flippase Atl1